MATADAQIVMTPVEIAILIAALAHYEEKLGERLSGHHREAMQSLRSKLSGA